MNHWMRSRPRAGVLALSLAVGLVACGSPADSEPRTAGVAGPPPAAGGPAPADTTSPAVLPPLPPVGPPRIAAKASPSIEECIEKNIHDKAYDSMHPRDTRRKLRRLQVKADCEDRLAAR